MALATNSRGNPTLYIALFVFVIGIGLAGCNNPFAPGLQEGDPFGTLLGDPTTIDGFFTNFEAAYELRDISLYEPLLDSAFTFTYYDFDVQVERQWGFAQDIESTRRLFQNASLIQLEWNQIISQTLLNENRQASIVRSFTLTINLEAGDVFRGDGRVNFTLTRDTAESAWQLLRWRDESEL